MRARRFTPEGLRVMAEAIAAVSVSNDLSAVHALALNDQFTVLVEPPLRMEAVGFETRLDMARYLDERFVSAGLPSVTDDVALWTWLSAFYVDQLCPEGAGGRRRPGEEARWILHAENHQRYYRHLMAAPYRIFRIHRESPDRALAVLCGSPATPGELNEQLGSRQELISSPTVMEVATRLYVDPSTRRPKKNAGGKKPGSARRLATVLRQFDLTWDLNSLSATELVRLLPREFDAFKRA